MKRFKKRTLALVLASVVTVVGAFAENNYKNSLMGISFESGTNGAVNMVLQTKNAYSGNVSPIKKDAVTYVLMLPEMNSKASTPDLSKVSGNISSVNIRTMPYSNNAKGYTRITIKTSPQILKIIGSNQIYIEDSNGRNYIEDNIVPEENIGTNTVHNVPQNEQSNEATQEALINENEKQLAEELVSEQLAEETANNEQAQEDPPVAEEIQAVTENYDPENHNYDSNSNSNNIYWIMSFLLVVLGTLYFFVRAKNKMREILGEKLDIDIADENVEEHDKVKTKTKELVSVIQKNIQITNKEENKVNAEKNVVDLDELFKEQNTKNIDIDEENEALEAFLSGFSFDESLLETNEACPTFGFDEEYYEKLISENNIRFTLDDITCINKLLGTEINDETRKNIKKYAVSNPISIKPSNRKTIEDIVTSYTISQGITFTEEDISILKKLMTVELDTDFVNDLRTNPERTREMEKQLKDFMPQTPKPSKILTLKVKDCLPNLSEEFTKLQGRRIESRYKHPTVYFSEGYDVATLKVEDKMPDLSVEINNEDAYLSQPSAAVQYMDEHFDLKTLKLNSSTVLPKIVEEQKVAVPIDFETEILTLNEDFLMETIENVATPMINEIPEENSLIEELEYTPASTTSENNIVVISEKENKISEAIQQKIVETKPEREIRKARIAQKIQAQKLKELTKEDSNNDIKCIFENEALSVVSTTRFNEDMGLHLAKNEKGYIVLGFAGEKLTNIKQYPELKSEKIQSRLSEQLDENISRYIVRIGINKFIVNVDNNEIKYVMDLC